MSYAEQAAKYADPEMRSRFNMAIREQAFIFADDGRQDIAALGISIVGGNASDIDAVIAAIVTGPNWAELDQDGPLLAAVQGVWPKVAAATHALRPSAVAAKTAVEE